MAEDLRHKHWELTGKIIQCGINVHNYFGSGYDTKIYKNAMAVEMSKCGLKHDESMPKLFHKKVQVGTAKADSIVDDTVMLKYRSQVKLTEENFRQGLSHLKGSHFEIGLLLNFGGKKLEFRRLFNNRIKKKD